MGTAQSVQPPPADAVDLTADSAEPSGSFWTGAPKLLAAFATLLGSVVALTTVLVQAGVIGSQGTAQTTPTVSVQPVSETTSPAKTTQVETTPVHTTPTVPPVAVPSLDPALGDLNELLSRSAHTKGDLGMLIRNVGSSPPAIDRATALQEIDAIVRQREGLHAELADFDTPAPLAKALALLRDSITASLADDRLVRQWIVARYDGDGSANAIWQAQVEASGAASEAKRTFKAEYADRLQASGVSFEIPEY